jgi:hypothetical protein
LLAFPGVSRVFPADAALGLSPCIVGEKNTAVNRIFGQYSGAKQYIPIRLCDIGNRQRKPERAEDLGESMSPEALISFAAGGLEQQLPSAVLKY